MVKGRFTDIALRKQPLYDYMLEGIRSKPDRIALVSHYISIGGVLSNLFDPAGRKDINYEAAGRTSIHISND